MSIAHRLSTDWHNLPSAIQSSHTAITLLVSFFAITWAFGQIIFPRLRKLDKIQDSLFDQNIPYTDFLISEMEQYKKDLAKTAQTLESLLLKYETAYKTTFKLALRASLTFIIFTAFIVLFSSSNNYALMVLYILLAIIMVALILSSYPKPNRIRSLKYLVHHFGFNPWVVWAMMRPGFFIEANPYGIQDSQLAGHAHFVLKQDLFVTGWTYYLEVSTHLNSSVYLAGSGRVSLGKSTIKHYSDFGVKHYVDMGYVNFQEAKLPIKNNQKELEANLLIIAPAFKSEVTRPFMLDMSRSIPLEAAGYSSGGVDMRVSGMSQDSGITLRGVGTKFKLDLVDKTQASVNKEVFKSLRKYIEAGVRFSLSSLNGTMETDLKTKKSKLTLCWLYWTSPLHKKKNWEIEPTKVPSAKPKNPNKTKGK